MTDWCILRTSPGRTLAVIRSLKAAGFEVWTPMGMRRRYRPRSTKYRDEPAALLPTFAFARYDDAARLAAIAQPPASDHPPFTLLMHRDVYGRVADRSLDPLREHEVDKAAEWEAFVMAEEAARLEKLRKKKHKRRRTGKDQVNAARSYVLGQRVRVTSPAFEGLTAKVIESRRSGDLVIAFDGLPMELVVETCDVRPVLV